jgi:quinol-cytochrome oxidoreductase complex cytochrome b subunit
MSDKPIYEAGFGSDALATPQRVVFVTRKTSAKVRESAGRQLMAYPHLLLRESIAFQVLTIVLVVIGLFWDAPLEQLANPLVTPNPAKAPWYFLGLQELLHYFPPVVAGILIPTLVVVALVIIPYSKVNVEGRPLWEKDGARRFRVIMAVLAVFLVFLGKFEAWTVLVPTVIGAGLLVASYMAWPRAGGSVKYLREQPLSWWVMSWFIAVAITLTLVGTFFRGPGWSWVWPWR